jgi:hypothetical protein
MDVLTSRNIVEIVANLQSEITKTAEDDYNTLEGRASYYHGILIRDIYRCAV